MQLEVKKIFGKDLQKIPIEIKKEIPAFFKRIEEIESISNFGNGLEKLVGFKEYYKYRIGNYRIGLKAENKTCTIIRILHRKEIYKYFPPK
jgi:mRNA interferase RelE/StbE